MEPFRFPVSKPITRSMARKPPEHLDTSHDPTSESADMAQREAVQDISSRDASKSVFEEQASEHETTFEPRLSQLESTKSPSETEGASAHTPKEPQPNEQVQGGTRPQENQDFRLQSAVEPARQGSHTVILSPQPSSEIHLTQFETASSHPTQSRGTSHQLQDRYHHSQRTRESTQSEPRNPGTTASTRCVPLPVGGRPLGAHSTSGTWSDNQKSNLTALQTDQARQQVHLANHSAPPSLAPRYSSSREAQLHDHRFPPQNMDPSTSHLPAEDRIMQFTGQYGRSFNEMNPCAHQARESAGNLYGLPSGGMGDLPSRSDHRSWGHQEPKVTLPLFKGKSEWRTFWLQFDRMARRFAWTSDETLDRLVSCLRDEALHYYAEQSAFVRADLHLVVSSFGRRFDDRKLPETYRASLHTLRRQSKESLEEYAARVRKVVNKAYPGIGGTALLEDMTIEHLVSGLTDQNLMYDVLTKKPHTVEEAMDLIQWHESCKGATKKHGGIRQVAADCLAEADSDLSIRRVNGKASVTEERLSQFGRELKDCLVDEIKGEMQKLQGMRRPRSYNRDPDWRKTARCYECQEIGHLARDCPTRAEAQKSGANQGSDGTPAGHLN